jgi:hypothetical protein
LIIRSVLLTESFAAYADPSVAGATPSASPSSVIVGTEIAGPANTIAPLWPERVKAMERHDVERDSRLLSLAECVPERVEYVQPPRAGAARYGK